MVNSTVYQDEGPIDDSEVCVDGGRYHVNAMD